MSKGPRSSSASLQIKILEENVPSAVIISSSFSVFDSAKGYAKVNVDSRMNLELEPSQVKDGQSYFWSVASEVGDSALTQAGAVPMGFGLSSFVLKAYSEIFVPGLTYSISLTVTEDGRLGRNEITLLINLPPSSGSCEVCNLDAAGTCSNSGIAMITTFRVSCSNWADEDLPLSYIYGFEMVGGDGVSFSPKDSPYLDQLVGSSTAAMTVQVQDSLDALTPVQRLPISINTGRRLLTWATGIENALSEAEKAKDQGDAAKVNSLAQVIAVDLASSANTYTIPERRLRRSTLEQLISSTLASAAPTIDYATETMSAGALVASVPCELSTESLESLMTIVETVSKTSTSFTPFPAAFGHSLASALRYLSASHTTLSFWDAIMGMRHLSTYSEMPVLAIYIEPDSRSPRESRSLPLLDRARHALPGACAPSLNIGGCRHRFFYLSLLLTLSVMDVQQFYVKGTQCLGGGLRH